MPKILSKLFSYLLTTSVVILSLLAVLSGTARWLVYDVEQYRDAINSYFSSRFDSRATIGALRGRTDFFDAIIVVEDIRLSTAGTQAFVVEQAEVVLDLFASIRTLEPKIKSIRMAGMELALRIDRANKQLHIPQLNYQQPLLEDAADLTKLLTTALSDSPTDIGFYDTKIYLQDTQLAQAPFMFQLKHLVVEPSYFGTKIGLDLSLPEYFGKHLTVVAQLEGAGQTITGDFYLNIDTVDIAHAYQLFGMKTQRSGQIQTELWGQWSSVRGLHNLSGTLALTDYRAANSALHLETKLSWQAQQTHRQLMLADFSLRSSSLSIVNANLAALQSHDGAHYRTRLRIAAEHIPAKALNQLIAFAKPYWRSDFIQARALGDDNQLDLKFYFAHGREWFAAPNQWQAIPALFMPERHSAPQWLALDTRMVLDKLDLSWHRWPRQQHRLHRVELTGTYIHRVPYPTWQIDHLALKQHDTELAAQLSYQKSDASSDLSLNLHLVNLPAKQIAPWLPQGYLRPALERWLLKALRDGQIEQLTVTLNGDPSRFPFKDGGGQWRLAASTKNLDILYRSKDPQIKEMSAELLIENQALTVRSNYLKLMDFYAKQTTVQIKDIMKPYIEISSDGRGPLSDILSYLQTRGLVDPSNVLIARLSPQGKVRLKIDVNTPLSRSVEQATYVGGFIDFEGADLSLDKPQWDFNDLQGRLYFDSKGGRADALRAQLNGRYPLVARAEAKDGSTLLKIDVRMPFYQIYPPIVPSFKSFISDGLDDWHAELLIPPLKMGHQQALELKLQSDLKQIAVHAPEPLHKKVGVAVPSVLAVTINPSASRYRLDYGQRLRLHLNTSQHSKPSGQLQFSPHLKHGDPTPRPGFFVTGVVERLPVDAWLDWSAQHRAIQQLDRAYIGDIDLLVQQARWRATTLNNLSLRITHKARSTVARFHSKQVAGRVSVPFKKAERIYLDLDHLILSPDSLSTAHRRPLDPTKIPPMAIKIGYFDNSHFDIDNLSLLLNPNSQGVDITEMSFEKILDDEILMEAKLRGQWTKKETRQHSDFQLKLMSKDYGRLLKSWQLYDSLKGAKGLVNGRLTWDGSPLDVALEKLHGSVRLQIDDGVIETVEPGVGRLLGLLNVGTLARRFKLDFKDVLDKGLEFDTVRGSFKFKDANMWTDDFKLDSTALEMQISGRTGIKARDYDQTIKVTPHLSSSIPWATAFIGGPLAGAAAFLFSKVTDIGEVVDKALTLDYTLTGSWDKPQVKFVGTPSIDTIKQPAGKIKQLIDKVLPTKKQSPHREPPQQSE